MNWCRKALYNRGMDEFLASIKSSYLSLAPRANAAYDFLDPEGSHLDHVAFRAFNVGKYTIDTLEPLLLSKGFHHTGDYRFPDRHVKARSYSSSGSVPRIFLSELLVQELPPFAQDIIASLVATTDDTGTDPFCDIPWRVVKHDEYQKLLSVSEYAAWVAANGLLPNHLTVNVTPSRVSTAISSLMRQGFKISNVGGVVKGGPNVLLEQGSTVADVRRLGDGEKMFDVATAYCEFATRWSDPVTGQVFDKFVEGSADNIFDSTNLQKQTTRALAIVKPDGVRRNLTNEVLRSLIDANLNIIEMTKTTISSAEAEEIYAAHKEKDFFGGLVEFTSSGHSVVIEVQGTDCARRLREVVLSIRARYATSTRENVMHGSDSDEAGEREARIFF